MNIQTITYWVMGVLILGAAAIGAWIFFITVPSVKQTTTTQQNGFGVGDTRTVTVLSNTPSDAENTAVPTTPAQQGSQKVFKVADGPVTTATLIQTYHPTTTLARYVQQENGHTFDIILENSGVVARAVSNTTIPGTAQGRWAAGGGAVVLQYLEDTTTKTVFVGLPVATTTASTSKAQPIRIQFFPDNIIDYALSPDGKNIVYLLKTATGSDGFIAKADGSSSKKLFSTPLSEVLVSWPALSKILLQTKSAAGVTGAVFSVSPQSGAVAPLVYAPGLTAIADATFTRVVYQTLGVSSDSYSHDVKTGKDKALSFSPIPEKCVWSKVKATVLYCAAPLGYTAPSYLDLWHRGAASMADTLFSFDVTTGQSSIIASPGGSDGGVAADITELSVSPDDHYLLFLKKGDRSLWGVRL